MRGGKWRWWLLGVLAACAGAVAVWLLRGRADADLPPLEVTYDGPSTGLSRTVVVPTLDTPIPEGKSAVWCGTFQLAWGEFKSKLARGDVRVEGADEVAGRLNAGTFAAAELSPGTHYAAAGLTRDGIFDTVKNDMARLFPGVTPPEPAAGDVALAYAYLRASVPFRLAYFEDLLAFRDAAGRKTVVRAFGLRERDESKAQPLRNQVGVLFMSPWEPERPPDEFALDLCRDSAPDQVIVARVRRGRTLGAVVDRVTQLAAKRNGEGHTLGTADHLLVPAMAWRVRHHYAELENRRLGGGLLEGLILSRAMQDIRFRLDRRGADVESVAELRAKGGPTPFHLDGPFLVMIKRRGAAGPYFAMWVDNAELLAPAG